MRYSGLDFIRKHIDIKAFEYDSCIIITTFKIGTRVFEQTTTTVYDLDLSNDLSFHSNEQFDLLKSRNKPIFIVIKDPLDRFLSGAIQVTFEGATSLTSAYSLAKWGTESYFFTHFWKEFVNTSEFSEQVYSVYFDTKHFKDVNKNTEVWKTWLDIIHFNIKMGDNHVSQYHKHLYLNLYKPFNEKLDITIITDTDLKDKDVFFNLTKKDLPPKDFNNIKWKDFLMQNIIFDIDYNLPRVSFNPFLLTEHAVEMEDYLTEEYRYYNKLKNITSDRFFNKKK